MNEHGGNTQDCGCPVGNCDCIVGDGSDVVDIYVTKYSLRDGLIEVVKGRISCEYAAVAYWRNGHVEVLHEREFHATEVAAQARVREMFKAKLNTLQKQMAKLKELEQRVILGLPVSKG